MKLTRRAFLKLGFLSFIFRNGRFVTELVAKTQPQPWQFPLQFPAYFPRETPQQKMRKIYISLVNNEQLSSQSKR